ncbi:MAG: hypothetical protein NC331_06415 [Lachnospiraceae bacterium]|nr:hypothetical protein [Lachnospiraceae bacterium]MCM1239004.1 hypothetical protein [Lachnospiraceae bacterium]
MDDKDLFPKQDTLGYYILELAAISGEFPAGLLARIPGSASYKESVITSLKKNALLRLCYKDKLRGYRLGRRAKSFLLAQRPERFAFYLTGNTDTNRIRSEVTRRLRLHRTAETYTSMQNAGVAVFRDGKPAVFLPEALAVPPLGSPAFYGSREIKEMGIETVKIKSSRMIGALLAPSGIFLTYNSGPSMAKWDYRAELRAQVFLKIILCHQRLSAQYAAAGISGLLFGDTLEPFYQILSSSDSGSRCFFLLDGDYEHFYYLTNDRRGDTLLKLLCSPDKTACLNRILMQGLHDRDPTLPIENDATDKNGDPVLFGYFLDIPRINRFHCALQLQGRTGTLVCFDFQCEVLRRFCGREAGLSTISFEKFERRFFP